MMQDAKTKQHCQLLARFLLSLSNDAQDQQFLLLQLMEEGVIND